MLERSVVDVLPQASLAACAASKAKLTSSSLERAIWQITSPVMGDVLSKYSPDFGASHCPLIKFPYFALNGNATSRCDVSRAGDIES